MCYYRDDQFVIQHKIDLCHDCYFVLDIKYLFIGQLPECCL